MTAEQKDPRFWEKVGRRIVAARDRLGLTQADLARQMGFKDRQTVSTIEAGKRKVSVEEILRLARILDRGIEYFTDAFVLAETGAFAWRARAEPEALAAFEEKAGALLAAYRHLGTTLGEPASPLALRLPLSSRPSFEECSRAGEQLADYLRLGEKPATRLVPAFEESLGILTLFVDPPEGVSAAACNLPDLKSVIINRKEPDGRRTFNAAHELFHLLTWDSVRRECEHSAEPFAPESRRPEQLADNFAAGLLMPIATVHEAWQRRCNRDIHDWLNKTAREFGVTSVALKYRARNLGLISKADLEAINDERLTWNGETPTDRTLPPLFSRRFMERIAAAIDQGRISVRRAAELLDTTIEGLARLFHGHDLPVPFDL